MCERVCVSVHWHSLEGTDMWTFQHGEHFKFILSTHILMPSEDHEMMGLKVDTASQRERERERERWRQGGVCSDPYKTGSVPCSVCRWLCCFLPMWWPNLYQKSHAPSHLLTD